MAPPYRKACYSCVKGKRRCDLGSPKCQRCTKRGLVCDYKSKSPATRGPISPDSPALDEIGRDNIAVETEPALEMMENLPDLSFNGNNSSAQETDETGLAQLSSWPSLNNLEDYTMESLEGGIGADFTFSIEEPAWLSTPAAAELDVETNCVISVLPFKPEDDYIVSGSMYLARIQYASRLFKIFPSMFVNTGQNPFIHRQLYKDVNSDTIQDALSCCSLYMAKNEQNEQLVFADITRKSKRLINAPQPFQSPVEHLAAIQALLLYEIIRLFDGNIRLRIDAEKDLLILEKWAEQLLLKTVPIASDTYTRNLDPILNTSVIPSWDSWIFEESSRRAILASYILIGVYSFIKDGFDRVPGRIHKLTFTAQAAIWNASSSFHWKMAFKDTKRFQLKVGDWDEVMEGVRPEDLDELGVMILACFKDLEYTCEWLGIENLEKYQLDSASIQSYYP